MHIPFNFQVMPEMLARLTGRDIYKIKRRIFDEFIPGFDKSGIYHVDLWKKMEEAPGHYYPEVGEVHMNPNGCKFAAEKLFEEIEHDKLLE